MHPNLSPCHSSAALSACGIGLSSNALILLLVVTSLVSCCEECVASSLVLHCMEHVASTFSNLLQAVCSITLDMCLMCVQVPSSNYSQGTVPAAM